MDRGYQNLKINTQLASLYRREFPDDLDQHRADPTITWWSRLRDHLKKYFETKTLTLFRHFTAKVSVNKKLASFIIPLICVCRLPEYAFTMW